MSHGAADAVPELPIRMATVNETAAAAKSRVFLMCPSRGRAVIGVSSPIDVRGCERSKYGHHRSNGRRTKGDGASMEHGLTVCEGPDTVNVSRNHIIRMSRVDIEHILTSASRWASAFARYR